MADNGDVALDLGGDEPDVLCCSLGAAKEINTRFGTMLDAARRVDAVDISAITFIIAKGLQKPYAAVEKKVYRAGVTNLIGPVNVFLINLGNGGKPKPVDDEDTDGDKKPGE